MAVRALRHRHLAIRLPAALLLVALGGCGGATTTVPPTVQPTSGPVATALPTQADVPTPSADLTATPTVTPAPTCVAPPAGIVGWWRAEGTPADAAGTNDGALQGGTTFAAGKVGQAFALDGAAQWVQVDKSSDLQLSTAITLEAWVYPAGAHAAYAGLAGTWDDFNRADRTYLFWVLGGRTELVISPDGAGYQRATDPGSLPLDQWSHVAGTYDGTAIRLYRDGVEVANVPTTGKIATNSLPFMIGRTTGGSVGPNLWKGSIDEMTVYSRALSAQEIAGIYAAGSAGKCHS